MTNEEKAREIANSCCEWYSKYNSSFTDCAKAALEMAEWKDQQFKEYLEKKRELLCYKPETERVCNYALLTEIINELLNNK